MAMIAYKDTYISGGVVEELYKAKKFTELDKHIAELDKVEKKRQGDPTEAIRTMRVKIFKNLCEKAGFTGIDGDLLTPLGVLHNNSTLVGKAKSHADGSITREEFMSEAAVPFDVWLGELLTKMCALDQNAADFSEQLREAIANPEYVYFNIKAMRMEDLTEEERQARIGLLKVKA